MRKYFPELLIVICIFLLACQDSTLVELPKISLDPGQNKKFTFTNKISGFYLGNSHSKNISGHDGWTVNELHYLQDYRIYLSGRPVLRDSITGFVYYPDRAVRYHSNGMIETMTLLDSINVLIIELELTEQNNNLTFEFIFDLALLSETVHLTLENNLVILPPQKLNNNPPLGIGSKLIPKNGGRFVIICTLNSEAISISAQIDSLDLKYEELISLRRKRLTDLIGRNNVITNIPEITDAVAWAQVSLDALVTNQRGKGIWAGLPWFNNYWGRDTFISFNGALLCSGRFPEAKEILLSFAGFQRTDKNDSWYGRIPNRVTNKEIIYNTTDGTWWFIREVYEYLLYSGDMDFVQAIFPVIKRAITGALQYRIDANFFLIHDDAETWMDAKGPEGAWSPRGNRAVEIQALWYTSLQIGAKLALIVDDRPLFEHWMAIADSLKRNFIDYYWNDFSHHMYDHINSDNSHDRKVRPNQIFSVTVPDLPGIVPLIPEEIAARVTNEVTQKLTYRYGVASLWQEDDNFHPWHHYQPFYVQDAAYHNGIVWTWLAGPVISSLAKFNYDFLCYQLYYNQAIQILYRDAIGNYSELLDALPQPGSSEPNVSGTVSQAWNLAEFTRNFYQDIIGFKPNALVDIAVFKPLFPDEIFYTSANVYMGKNRLNFTFQRDESRTKFTINCSGVSDTLQIKLDYAGFSEEIFSLNSEKAEHTLVYSNEQRLRYHLFTEYDWYFCQPELREDLPVLREPGHPVFKSSDWYFDPAESGATVIKLNDDQYDDKGPEGNYSYPLNPAFADGIFDITGVEILDLQTHWGFIINLRNLSNPNWHPEYGFQLTFVAIALRNTDNPARGRQKVERGSNFNLPGYRAFHDILFIGGGVELQGTDGKVKCRLIPDQVSQPLGFTARGEIRFKLEKSYLPYLNKDTRITLLSGAQDDHGGAGIGEFRAVRSQTGEWHGGGAPNDRDAPCIYDILEIN